MGLVEFYPLYSESATRTNADTFDSTPETLTLYFVSEHISNRYDQPGPGVSQAGIGPCASRALRRLTQHTESHDTFSTGA